MAVMREDLDAGRVDFSDLAADSDPVPLTHPGILLREDWLKPAGISAYRLAKDLGVPTNRITEILKGKRAISADTALRLARYFGTEAQWWLALQARYDLDQLAPQIRGEIARIPVSSAA